MIRTDVIPPIPSTSISAVADLPTVELPIAVRVALYRVPDAPLPYPNPVEPSPTELIPKSP